MSTGREKKTGILGFRHIIILKAKYSCFSVDYNARITFANGKFKL